MINKAFFNAAAVQLAADYNCSPEDFFAEAGKVTLSEAADGQRILTEKPSPFKAATFGKNTVISANSELTEAARELSSIKGTKLFDGSGIAAVNSLTSPHGYVIGMITQYYLPSDDFAPLGFGGYDLRIFGEQEIKDYLYPNFTGYDNALMYHASGNRRDVLAVCAVSGNTVLGMAGASNDSDTFWQIGIDVLPEHRGKGLAPILVSVLANEVIMRGKVPYYGTWSGNIFSQRTAIKSGFLPVWSEMHAVISDM